MARLPLLWNATGGELDANNWGQLYQDYLLVAHNTDGTLKATTAVTSSKASVTAIGGQANVTSMYVMPTASGSVQESAFWARIDGIATGGVNVYRIAGVIEAQTGGGSGANGIIGVNITMQQNSADSVAFINGLELAVNNLKRDDPLDPVDQNHYGMTIDAYGGFSIGPAALAIRKAAVSSTWQRGVWIPSGSITASGYAFDYAGNGSSGAVRITAESTLVLPLGSGTGVVSVGVADSGGVGFKLLRVPN